LIPLLFKKINDRENRLIPLLLKKTMIEKIDWFHYFFKIDSSLVI